MLKPGSRKVLIIRINITMKSKHQVLFEMTIFSIDICFYYKVYTEFVRRSFIKANTWKQRFDRIIFKKTNHLLH